jgi:hypothetical protein
MDEVPLIVAKRFPADAPVRAEPLLAVAASQRMTLATGSSSCCRHASKVQVFRLERAAPLKFVRQRVKAAQVDL